MGAVTVKKKKEYYVKPFQVQLLKTFRAAVGLVICSFGTYMELNASMGMSPWEALNQGVAKVFHTTYGTAGLAVAVLVFATDLVLKEHIGMGTLLDTLMVTKCVDLFSVLGIIPKFENFALRLVLFTAGMAVICYGQYVYISAGLCCGPRDSFLVAVGRRMRKVPIGVCNMGVQAVVLGIAVLLGCPVGAGTIIGVALMGPVMQLVFGLLRFEPRDVCHQGFTAYFAGFRS